MNKKKEESIFKSLKKRMQKVVRYECRDKNLEIYVVQPGERLTIYGSCSILCLAGNASINDYVLPTVSCESANFLKISAPQRMDVPAILNVGNSASNYKHQRLKFRLKEVAPKNHEKIMELIGTSQPAVFIFSKVLDIAEETVSGLIANFLIHTALQKQIILPPHFHIARDDFSIIPQPDDNKLKQQLEKLNSVRKDGQRVSIIPFGHKGAGKSHLMRNIVNRWLSIGCDNVYVLDCDIGQSEFTPSGCLSLHKVTSPIIGKPYGHQKAKFDNAFFYGDNSLRSPDLYLDIFERLWNKFKATSEPGSVCVINTMGWVTDLGGEVLTHIMDIVEPDLCVEIYRDSTETRFQYPKNQKLNYMEIFANNSHGIVGLPAQKKLPSVLIRELTIVGYFSSMLPKPSLASFPKVTPYKLNFQNTTICVPVDLLVQDCHIFSSINTQLIALCLNHSELKPRKLCGKEDMPSLCVIDGNSPALQCIGYGIVRGVNVDEKAIFVVSPVDLRELDEPPLLVRGMRIQTPAMFFTSDPYNRCPYVLNLPEQKNAQNNLDGLYQPSVNTTQFKRSRRC
uniref:CLP1_P domain-containing protein n=1 Tax=Caenorhabditis japonica TaxID=281687 RepID=A0A8R1DIE5_CAEJA